MTQGSGCLYSGSSRADVLALFAFVGSPNSAPHLPQWALLGSAVLMEIPIAMILACRLLPFRENRLANIIAGAILTLVNGFLTFVLPLTNGDFRDPIYPAYVFFATIETVCTLVIIRQAWTWSGVTKHEPAGLTTAVGTFPLESTLR